MPPHPRDRNLLADLDEQLVFLQNSCDLYDAGMEGEAKRIAVVIRVLVHDTKMSHSLLGQLDVKTALNWFDSADGIDPHNLFSTPGLTDIRLGASGTRYVPRAETNIREDSTTRRVDFREWWTGNVIKDQNGALFGRSDLVLALANQDGGAHIDRLKASTFALAHENSTGWETGVEGSGLPPEPLGSPILPSVRTIANELRLTLADGRSVIEGRSKPVT